MSDVKWRFPASGHAERKGISSGDTEAFKKSPFSAFAREILQNSIDARDSDEEPTIVEFELFELETSSIPGLEDLKNQIRRCKEFWAHKEEYVKEYSEMLTRLEEKTITCLRVSDFNTTGLIGVETNDPKENKFLALAKGTGVSEKTGLVSGGSKGVGKNAAFLMSSIKTVFYATKTNRSLNGSAGTYGGFMGVAELVSGYIDDSDVENRDYTQGIGYYSCDDLNSAIHEIMSVKPNYQERKSRTGTDIFIIGFNSDDEWKKEVINSILDSFMSTIVRGQLEVNVDGIEITKETIQDVVYNETIISKTFRSGIISQYRLLTDGDKVKVYDIETEYGNCELYILPYSKEDENLATHKCVMIRHPLMKIKDEPLGSSFRVSAMCIIGDGKLGQILRSIENPQHIDWEPKRVQNSSQRKEIENVIKSIRNQIKDKVIECLQIGNETPLDPNGAGDYLPDVDVGDANSDINGNQKPIESVSVSKPKENINFEKNATQENDDGKGIQPDIGDVDDEIEGNISHPSGENDTSGGGHHPGSESSGEKSGDNIIFKRYNMSGVRYKVISTNKSKGQLRVVFIAPDDYENCYLSISMLDDSNEPTPVKILSMKCNGLEIAGNNNIEYGPFEIRTNQKVVLDVCTDCCGYFGSEVKVIVCK